MAKNKMNLLQLYETILNSCGLVVEETGFVKKILSNGSVYPLYVPPTKGTNEKQSCLVLPTKKNQKDPEIIAKNLFFNPFNENLASNGEPRILNAIKSACLRTWSDFAKNIMKVMLEISNGSVNPSDLTEQQREVIERIGKVDDKLINVYKTIIKNMPSKNIKNLPLNLSLFKDFKYNGRKYKRGAVWSFPLIEDLQKVIEECNRDKSIKPRILGTDLRKSDLHILSNLFNVTFGTEEERKEAIGASDSNDAPYAESFIRALYYLKRINKLVEIFFKGKYHVYSKEVADNFLKNNTISLDWLSDDFKISDWKKEYLLLPQYEGNEGTNPINQNIEVKRKEKEDMHNWENIVEDELPWNDNENTRKHTVNNTVNNQTPPQTGYQKQNEPMSSGDSFLDRLSNQANATRVAGNGFYGNQPMNNVPPMQIDQFGREYYIDQFGRTVFTGNQMNQSQRVQPQPQMQPQFDNAGREFVLDQFNNPQYTGRQKQVDQFGRECVIDQYGNVQYTGRQFPVARPLASAAQMTMSPQPAYAVNPGGTFFSNNQQNYAQQPNMGYNRNIYPNNGYQQMPQSITGVSNLFSNSGQQGNTYGNNQVGLSGAPI